MTSKKYRRKMKMIDRDNLKAMLNDEDQLDNLEKFLKDDHSLDTIGLLMDLIRELRLEDLFEEEFDVSVDELNEAKKRIIKLKPGSDEYGLKSIIFRKHNGQYKVETLLNQYHDSILREGYSVGYDYGRKFLIQDIQSGRFSKDDIMKMTHDEILEYCEEVREEI